MISRRTLPHLRAAMALAALAALLPACGSSTGSASPKVATTLGEDEELFAVDWPTSMRAELEATARSGLAVVAVRGEGGVRLLPGCTARGRYAVTAVTPKEDLVRLASSREVKATLPFAAASFVDKVSAGTSEERVLDVAVVTRSIARAPALPFSRAELHGDCAGATHVVSGLVRGAFAIAARKKSDAAVAADVFGLAAGASDAQAELVSKSDGSLSSCRASVRSRDGGCDALLKVSLRPLATADADALTSRGSYWVVASCGDCEAECDRGDMDACATVGTRLIEAGDETKAERLLRAACNGKSGAGCTALGLLYDPNHNEGRGFSDGAKARALYAQACDMGALTACVLLAMVLDFDDVNGHASFARDVERASRGCDAGGGTVGPPETCFVVAGWFQREALGLEAKGHAGAGAALDRAIALERRRCAIGSSEHLASMPCRADSWQRYRARMVR